MTNLRNHAARIGREALDGIRSALGIASPSRAWIRGAWPIRIDDGMHWRTNEAPPWYAARAPLDAYASPELRRAARRVRRLIRRHWFALFFEPSSPEAMAVRVAMREPPSFERRQSLAEVVLARKLDAFSAIDPGEFAARYGVKWEGDS